MSVVLVGIGCPFFQGFCLLNLPHKLTGLQPDFRPIKVSVAKTGARLHVNGVQDTQLREGGTKNDALYSPEDTV